MAGRYDVSFLARELCGTDVVTVRLSRPDGYDFRPGQWFTLSLDTETGPVTETFSHCSAPQDDYLEMTTRMSGSAYKNALGALTPGAMVRIAGPGGRLRLPEDADKVTFLVGGVGITPVRCMLRDARNRGRVFADALLLYGNRDDSCVPFREEFESMADMGVRTVICFEEPPAGWQGESGFITADTVRRHTHTAEEDRPYVIAGPPAMVAAMERVLDDLGVPVDRRLIERFGRSE